MKTCRNKYLFTLLLLAMSVLASAQSAPSAQEVKMRTVFMLNAGISQSRLPAIGFTLARVGNFGYYANFMIGIDNLHLAYDYSLSPDDRLLDGSNAGSIPFFSGNRAINRFSVSAGGFARLKIPLFLYAGAGYGFRTETRELLNNEWALAASSLGHSAVVEAGLMGQVGDFVILAGYTLFIGRQMQLHHEARVGVGYMFNR